MGFRAMPLKIPDDLLNEIASVREDNGDRWCIAGYDGSKALKLISCGEGDSKELTDAIADPDQVYYGVINSPNGIKMAYVEWVGENVNGMKKSYILRNKSQTTDLFGYTHFTFRHSDKAELDAEMTENGEFMGPRTLGEVGAWDPNIKDWESMWNETNPIDGWDPNSQWVYKWNPYGLLEFGQLPETDMPLLKNIYTRCNKIPKSIVPQEFMDKLKKIQDAEKDEDLPEMTEEDMIMAARCEAVIDIFERKQKEVGKLKSVELPKEPEKAPKKKMKKLAPAPEPEAAKPKIKKLAPAPAPAPEPVPVPEPAPKADAAPVEKCYFIYTTSLGANPSTQDQVNQLKLILDINQIKYEEIDLYMDGCMGGTKGKEMVAKSGTRQLPQIFINDVYLEGGFEEFRWKNELGEL